MGTQTSLPIKWFSKGIKKLEYTLADIQATHSTHLSYFLEPGQNKVSKGGTHTNNNGSGKDMGRSDSTPKEG